MKQIRFSVFILLLVLMTSLWAQTDPTYVVLQGVLRDQQNRAVADGEYTMTFSFYTQKTGGNPIWTSLPQGVRVQNGVFSTKLSGFNSDVTFADQYYVGILVIGNGAELSPRMELTAAPYAMAIRGEQNVITGTGNIGLGTLNPTERLEVQGNVKASGKLLAGDSVSLGSKIRFKSANGGIYDVYNKPLVVQAASAGGGTQLMFGPGGSITSPFGFSLSTNRGVELNNNTPLKLSSSDAGNGVILSSTYPGASVSTEYSISRGKSDGSKNSLVLHTPSSSGSGVSIMATGNKTLMQVDAAAGNTGIGAAPNANAKLNVGGSLYTRGSNFLQFAAFEANTRKLDINTNYDANEWVGIYAGVNGENFDLRSQQTDVTLEQYCYVKNGTIWVKSFMPTNDSQVLQRVYVIFIRKELVDGSNPAN